MNCIGFPAHRALPVRRVGFREARAILPSNPRVAALQPAGMDASAAIPFHDTRRHAMTQGTHWLRSALLALLALALLSGGSFAAGDLFDDAYHDCPAKTRLRDGQIADLTLARDAEEEDEVNVSWAATDPATWGLGANAYSASLVLLLDDGGNDLQAKAVSLGTRKQTFTGVATGAEVTVQMAIVVDTAEGDYLISDILEATVHQSLTAPSFSADWLMSRARPAALEANPDYPHHYLLPGLGQLYYIGYNENFGNYRAGYRENADGELVAWSFPTRPATPSFRIGLAHGGEDDEAREDVKFDAYVIRLLGADDGYRLWQSHFGIRCGVR